MAVRPFPVAGGPFLGAADLNRSARSVSGSAIVPNGIGYKDGMYCCQVFGHSMEPDIPDRWWAIFHPAPAGSREGRLVHVEDREDSTHSRHTVKRYTSEKDYQADGTWNHTAIELLPLNKSYEKLCLSPTQDRYAILGWYVGCVPEITPVNSFKYPQLIDGYFDDGSI